MSQLCVPDPPKTRYYKWLAAEGPVYGVGGYARPGEWQPRMEGPLVVCRHGYHILTAEQVSLWCGDALIEVEPQAVEISESEKCVCRTWREVRRFRWTRKDMVAYAQACAERASKHAAAARAAAARATAATATAAAAVAAADAAGAARAATAADAAAAAAAVAAADVADECGWQRAWIEDRIGERL